VKEGRLRRPFDERIPPGERARVDYDDVNCVRTLMALYALLALLALRVFGSLIGTFVRVHIIPSISKSFSAMPHLLFSR
jgi:hypothetical protein